MRNYEEPRLDIIELEAKDIIQTSGILTPGGDAQIPGTGVIVPIPGASALDSTY